MDSAFRRVVGVVGIGVLVLAAVVGSIWLSQADVLMTARGPTDELLHELLTLGTPTLFPTLSPTTPTAVAQASPIVDDTPQATTTTEPQAQTPSPTLSATAEVEPTPCEAPAGWIAYTVRRGDSFQSLARLSQTNPQGLLQGNCLSEAGELAEGMVLYLPAIAQATPTPAPACGPPPEWLLITVRPGETLYALSLRYGVTVNALRNANCLVGDLIKAGDRLYAPRRIVVPPTVPPTIVWWTPVPPASETPTVTPTPTLTAVPTVPPTATLTPSATPTPTETPVLVPTWTPWLTPTSSTPDPEITPTSSTPDPAATPTAPAPSVTPTDLPAATATPESAP